MLLLLLLVLVLLAVFVMSLLFTRVYAARVGLLSKAHGEKELALGLV